MSTVLNNATSQVLNAEVPGAKANVGKALGPIPRGANRKQCILTAGGPTVSNRQTVRRVHARRLPKRILEAGLVPRNLLLWDKAPYPFKSEEQVPRADDF